jgi:hypothetical protein
MTRRDARPVIVARSGNRRAVLRGGSGALRVSDDGDRRAGWRWPLAVVLGTSATVLAAASVGGAAGLAVGLLALAAAPSGELLGLVQQRSHDLHESIVRRLAEVRIEHADERVDALSHDPLRLVTLVLVDGERSDAAVTRAIEDLRRALARVRTLHEATRAQRRRWQTDGQPELIGGLARARADDDVKHYGDPANLPAWLRGRGSRAALLRVGRVLDDVRLLHSNQIERVVLTFTLWARALLLVLAPALGAFTVAPPPRLDGDPLLLVPWLLALVWALAAALAAPRIARLAMAESAAGLRMRRVLLAVELPLAVALALTVPAWPAVAFAAGWTNWWQRLGRTPAVPDFSWTRLAIWIAITVGTQSAGVALAATDPAWWAAGLEVTFTVAVIAVIGGSYGAMLPVSTGVAVRVLVAGDRHRRLAGSDAQSIIDDVAATMTRAADALARTANRTPADEEAASVLRRAVESMLPVAAPPRPGARTLETIATRALIEGGHHMWAGDPRAASARDRAEHAGQVLPVIVGRPSFDSDELEQLVLPGAVADNVHRLLVACIVEARVHGTRRVQTIISGDAACVEIRVANQPRPDGSQRGGGRGGREIERLARSLPGAGEPFRGSTDRAFARWGGSGDVFGVRFTFDAGDTQRRAHGLPDSDL